MPRVEISETVQDSAGNGISGASVQVNKREGGAATVFQAETGSSTFTNPLTTDSAGRISGWLEGGSYDLIVTPSGGSPVTQQFEASSGRNATITGAFPTNPADGEIVNFLADSTNGIVWTFKFRAASASSFKWEFVGGPPLITNVAEATLETTSSTSYVALATAGPTLTIPLQGDYMVEHGAWIDVTVAPSLGIMSYDIGGTAASDNQAAVGGGNTTADRDSIYTMNKLTAVAASTTLTSKYKVNAGTAGFRDRWMKITPLRVNG